MSERHRRDRLVRQAPLLAQCLHLLFGESGVDLVTPLVTSL